MTYLALGQQDAALDQLRRALELAGPDDSRPQFEIARAEVAPWRPNRQMRRILALPSPSE
jgi:hypothetical protein